MDLAQTLALVGGFISLVAIISGIVFIFTRRIFDVEIKSHGHENTAYNWKQDEKLGSFYMKVKLPFLVFVISAILSVSISITAIIVSFLA